MRTVPKSVMYGGRLPVSSEDLAPRWLDARQYFDLWSQMLVNSTIIYNIGGVLRELSLKAELLKKARIGDRDREVYDILLNMIIDAGGTQGLIHTAEMAKKARERKLATYTEIYHTLVHLDDSIRTELKTLSAFRLSPDRIRFYNHEALFGVEVASAFPSCEHDIRRAGNCFAFEQPDACVYHLMLTLERGLHALAGRLGVSYEKANWQVIINHVAGKVKTLPTGSDREFYASANAQFGFLKDAYRNHIQHARDFHYDMERAHNILDHVRTFMGDLTRGGLSEDTIDDR